MADESVKPAATSDSPSWIDKTVPFFLGHRTEITLVLAGIAGALRIAFPNNPAIERYVAAVDALLLPLGLGFLSARVQRNFVDKTSTSAPITSQTPPVDRSLS